jgi:uncharacterized protein with ParB-like and HNH nuclease domain
MYSLSKAIELRDSMSLSHGNMIIGVLLDWKQRGDFLIPDYQRDLVWDDEQKALFIESIILGFPIPTIFLHRIEDANEMIFYNVIDGQQRLDAIDCFFDGTLKINKGTSEEYDISSLCKRDLFKIKNSTIPYYMVSENTSLKIIEELFKRINATNQAMKSHLKTL